MSSSDNKRAPHSILDFDRATRTGMCAVCGPVEVRIRRWNPSPRGKGHGELVECRTRVASTERNNWHTRLRYADGRLPDGMTRHAARVRLKGAACETCGAPAVVNDHCHTTHRLRGTLCRECNLALGNVEDDPARLRALADYVERYAREGAA